MWEWAHWLMGRRTRLRAPQGQLPDVAVGALADGSAYPSSRATARLMWEWAHWLTDRRTRLRAPQHDLCTHKDSLKQGIWRSHRRLTPSPLVSHSTLTEHTLGQRRGLV
ncbi:unnamed protein product [Schistocephalus solidus]|uniref:Transposase n=1 Tax=Schistocephalus solidus TaxID=70667 RepID=A0A183TU46_SCHSO|nr:unnamed protein product [Schistocephalus solidus]